MPNAKTIKFQLWQKFKRSILQSQTNSKKFFHSLLQESNILDTFFVPDTQI